MDTNYITTYEWDYWGNHHVTGEQDQYLTWKWGKRESEQNHLLSEGTNKRTTNQFGVPKSRKQVIKQYSHIAV